MLGLEPKNAYLFAADAVLTIHFLFVAFVLLGLCLIIAGKLASWQWVRNPWFRALHLLAIGIVVIQSWLGVVCPLTRWESALRAKAGGAVYSESFISHWLTAILYYQAPPWVFTVAYSLFGLLVLTSWYYVRPRSFANKD